MNRVSINSVKYGLQFKYKYIPSKRLSIEKTINSVIIQTQDYVLLDTNIEFEYPRATSTERSALKDFYEKGTTFTFRDYDGNSYTCLMIEYSEEEVLSKYNIKGTMKILGTVG